MSNYNQMIESLRTELTAHNEATDDSDCKINVDNIVKTIKQHGGTTEKALREMRWEDLQECGVPRLLARSIATNVFRAPQPTTPNTPTASTLPAKEPGAVEMMEAMLHRLGFKKPVEDLSLEELVRMYDPDQDDTHPVNVRLLSISHGTPFVVFEENDREVDTKFTLEYLKDAKEEEEPHTSTPDGRPVYGIGEKPGQIRRENPLFPGKALRRSGECTVTKLKWNPDLEVQQLAHIGLEIGDIVVRKPADAKPIIKQLQTAEGVAEFKADNPDTVAEFRKRKIAGTLPTLIISKDSVPKPINPRSDERDNGGRGNPRGGNPPPRGGNFNSPHQHLSVLLASLFSGEELRRFMRNYYSGLANNLPGGTAGLAQLADSATESLFNAGCVDVSLRTTLLELYPRRRDSTTQSVGMLDTFRAIGVG